MSQNKRHKRNKTLRHKINKYICKKDICCEEDVDRKMAIDHIFILYTEIASFMNEQDEYLSYINNDLVKFIGYKVDLKKDKEGLKLWNEIDRNTSSKEKIIEFLNKVPLYYLLSFLGYAYYKKSYMN